MKKMAVGIVGIALAVGVILVWSRPVRNYKPEIHEKPAPKEMPAPKPAARQEGLVVRPPIAAAAPFQVGFSPAGAGKLEEPIAVDLVVTAQPESWVPDLAGEGTLAFLLRLPLGVKLSSEGWESVKLPSEEEKDASGPWSLFERKIPVMVPAAATGELARERVQLTVVQPGVNWIITTRARITRGTQSWQTFGVVFATVDANGRVELHAAPRTIQTEQRAQAN